MAHHLASRQAHLFSCAELWLDVTFSRQRADDGWRIRDALFRRAILLTWPAMTRR